MAFVSCPSQNNVFLLELRLQTKENGEEYYALLVKRRISQCLFYRREQLRGDLYRPVIQSNFLPSPRSSRIVGNTLAILTRLRSLMFRETVFLIESKATQKR